MIYRSQTVARNGAYMQSLAGGGTSPARPASSPERRTAARWCWGLGLLVALAAAGPAWAQDQQDLTVIALGVSACEGNDGADPTTKFRFLVRAEEASEEGGQSFSYHTAGLNDNFDDVPLEFAGAPLAEGDVDYEPEEGTITFGPGQSEVVIEIEVYGDTDPEPTEFFFLIFNEFQGVDMDTPFAIGAIINDENADGVIFSFPTENTVMFMSTVLASPPDKPDPADEYWRFGREMVYKGQLGYDSEGEPIPSDNTWVLQCWVNGLPVFRIGGRSICGNIYTEPQLELITFENIETVIVYAGEGDDWVNGTFFVDDNTKTLRLYGEDGNDVLMGGDGDDYLSGGNGNDYLDGGAGNDRAPDGFPQPWITGGPGDDIVIGGAGDDVLSGGTGRNIIRGGSGRDDLWAHGSYDVLDYSTAPDGVDINLPAGTGADGTGSNDIIHLGFDVLRGSHFNDTLIAYRRNGMTILGGFGNDTITGSVVGDILYGEDGNDTIYGDPTDLGDGENGGADIILGGAGEDEIYGGPGSDEIYGDGDYVPQNFDEDRDAADYWPDDQFIQLTLHPLSGQYGAGRIGIIQDYTPFDPDEEPPFIDTSGVLNIANCLRSYTSVPVPISVVDMAFSLPCSEITTGPVSLASVGVRGGADDEIRGGGAGDLIAGGVGNDEIYGGSHLFHVDITPSGNQNDRRHRDGADLIFGDYVVNRPQALLANGSWGPWIPTPDDLLPSRFGGNDDIRGGFGADTILGGGGSDQINGNRGDDVIYGDFYFPRGDDDTYALINSSSICGADYIRGNEGTDYIFGGPGNDYLLGGDECDPEGYSERGWDGNYGKSLLGENGDVIQGNSGNDTIVGADVQMGSRNIDDDLIDRGLYRDRAGTFGVDCVPQDTVDYTMVPIGVGINVDLGESVPGGFYTVGIATEDGEGGTDYIYGIENVIGTRNADVIKGSTTSDETLRSGRYRNNFVTDAFGYPYFPAYPSHPSGNYTRTRMYSGYDNILLGEDNDDIIMGRRGNDALCGGNGNDKIWGDGHSEAPSPPPDATNPDDPATLGSDEIWGDQGDDELYGEWGDDIIHGGAGVDYLSGGSGTDVLAFTERDEVGEGGVVVNLDNAPIDLTLWGDIADKYASYGWPLNPVTALVPPLGWPAATIEVPDDMNPGQVTPLVFPGGTVLPAWPYNSADITAGRGFGVARAGGFYKVIVNRYVEDDQQQHPDGSVLHQDRFEIIYGTTASDVIYGHSVAPTIIWANGGNDILVGGAGDDTLYGNTGSDVLEGRGGNDLLVGSEATPTPPGPQLESPSDWASYQYAPGPVVVNLSETENQDTISAGVDRLIEIENVLGSSFDDSISGNWRVNVLLGGDGNDTLVGRSDHDIRQNNRVYVRSDTLNGGAGQDTAEYRYGNPAEVAAAAANLEFGPCPAPDLTDVCGFMEMDGEGGSDKLVNIENIRMIDDQLIILPPSKKITAPGHYTELTFYVTGGDGRYKVKIDPTTATKDLLNEDGRVRGTTEVAILAAPADQNAPASPFVYEQDLPAYKAFRELTGSPAPNGLWKFVVYARPLETTSFRVTVTDANDPNKSPDAPAPREVSKVVEVVVAEELVVRIDQPRYTLTAGFDVQLRGSVSGGTPPYKIRWTASDGSQATTLSATNVLTPTASPTATTTYTLTVEDSTPDSLNQEASAETVVNVTSAPADSSGSPVPSDSQGGSSTTNPPSGNPPANNQQTPTEVSDTTEAVNNAPVAPMCGFGVTSWAVLGNLLLLAVMKRRRW